MVDSVENCQDLLEPVHNECCKLEFKGHQYFLVMCSEKYISQIGSDKGRQFLEANSDLVQKFFEYCYGASVEGEHVSSGMSGVHKSGLESDENHENTNQDMAAMETVTTNTQNNNSTANEGDDIGRDEVVEESDEKTAQVMDESYIDEKHSDISGGKSPVCPLSEVITDPADQVIDEKESDLDMMTSDSNKNMNDNQDIVRVSHEADSKSDAAGFLQQIDLTPLNTPDASKKRKRTPSKNVAQSSASVSSDNSVQAMVSTSPGEPEVKRSYRLKIKKEMKEKHRKEEEEDVKTIKRRKLTQNNEKLKQGKQAKGKQTETNQTDADRHQTSNTSNCVLMPVKVKLSGSEEFQDGLRVCNSNTQTTRSSKVQKVKIVKVLIDKDSEKDSPKKLSDLLTKNRQGKSKSSASVSKQTKKSTKKSPAKQTTQKSKRMIVNIQGPKTKTKSDDVIKQEPQDDDDVIDEKDDDTDGIALYEEKVKDASWKPKKRKTGTKPFGTKKRKGRISEQYDCEKCGKAIISKGAYVKHMLVHTLKPCKYCGEMPADEEDMRLHRIKCWKQSYKDKRQSNITSETDLTCDVCQRVCFTAGALKRHKTIHNLKCRFCKVKFTDEESLRTHKETCSVREKELKERNADFLCKRCGRLFFNKGSFVKHRDVHKENDPIRCFFCGKTCTTDEEFMEHIATCESRSHCLESEQSSVTLSSPKERPTCKMCSKSFSSMKCLKAHLLLTHFSESQSQSHKCSFCDKVLANVHSKNSHEKFFHSEARSYVCDVCGSAVKTKSSLRKHMNIVHGVNNPGTWKCDTCDKTFKCQLYLTKHQSVHEENRKQHKCELCSKLFSSVNCLKNHIKYIHVDTKDFVCDICGRAYKKKSYLQAHIRVGHGRKEDRPFECKICHKRFPRRIEYMTHLRTHTGEKPYICEICGDSFGQKGNMLKHQRCMHPREGDKIYECELCGKKSHLMENHYAHMRLHMIRLGKVEEVGKKYGKFYQCKICDKYFSQSMRLTIHIRSHTGERPYSCSNCNRSFASKSKLTRHQKQHCKYRHGDNDQKLNSNARNVGKGKVVKVKDNSTIAMEAVQYLVESLQEKPKEAQVVSQSIVEVDEEIVGEVTEAVEDYEANAAAKILTENNLVQNYQYVNLGQQRYVVVMDAKEGAVQTGSEYVVIDSTAEEIPVIYKE